MLHMIDKITIKRLLRMSLLTLGILLVHYWSTHNYLLHLEDYSQVIFSAIGSLFELIAK